MRLFYLFLWVKLQTTRLPTSELVGDGGQANNKSQTNLNTQTSINLQPVTRNSQTLVLSQAFDEEWHAYSVGNFQFTIFNFQIGRWLENVFPFIFGKEIKNHVLVNNWENGWQLESVNGNDTVVIFFLPQLLQYLGFALLLASISIFWIIKE